MTTLYHAHPENGLFLQTTQADLDPLDGEPMVPAHATLTAPPDLQENEAAVLSGGEWHVVADYRGAVYWLADGSHHKITETGIAPPDGALDQEPPKPRDVQRAEALALIDLEHARHMESLTGSATTAERDTWDVKAAAARAVLTDAATAGQTEMLTLEATGAGVTVQELAEKIAGKADAFAQIVGLAGAIRAQAKAAVIAATDEAVPLDQVADQITAAFAASKSEIETQIAALQAAAQT